MVEWRVDEGKQWEEARAGQRQLGQILKVRLRLYREWLLSRGMRALGVRALSFRSRETNSSLFSKGGSYHWELVRNSEASAQIYLSKAAFYQEPPPHTHTCVHFKI